MRLTAILTLMLWLSAASAVRTTAEDSHTVTDPELARAIEFPLPHAFCEVKAKKWTAGRVGITVDGSGGFVSSWVVADGDLQLMRLHTDDRDLVWKPPHLTGSIRYAGLRRDDTTAVLTIDLTVKGNSATGSYEVRHVRAKKGEAAEQGSIKGRAWTPGQMPERNRIAADWAGWRGGHWGGVAAPEREQELVDRVEDARFVWKSSVATPMPGHTDAKLLGGYGEIAVGDGKVFINYYTGHGDIYGGGKTFEQIEAMWAAKMAEKPNDYVQNYFRGDHKAYVQAKWTVLGDDVVECYDAASGILQWRIVYDGKGLNWHNCDGPHFYPAYENGLLAVVGSAGRLYGLDAETGRTLWEGTLPGVQSADAWQQEAIEGAKKPTSKFKWHGPDNRLVYKPRIIDGVLLVAERNLYGIDARTGKQLWGPVKEVGSGNPRPWQHGGKTYALCMAGYGKSRKRSGLVCVDPQTGTVLWQDPRIPGGPKEIAHDDNFVFSAGVGQFKDRPTGDTILEPTCYKITTQGLEKLWSLPLSGTGAKMAAPVLYKGYVYSIWDGEWDGEPLRGWIVCVEAATGKVIGRYPINYEEGVSSRKTWQGLVAGNDRLIYLNGQAYYGAGPGLCYFQTGADFKVLSSHNMGKWPPGTHQVLSPVLVDGRFLVREKGDSGVDGSRIYCFDLRKQ